jgi:signal-transduction protein with cAMP-binding, CBS, and nucleotidyltransferase domain
MTVGDICNRRVPIAPGTTSVLAAAKSMHALDEGFLVVTEDRDGRRFALGIVTDRELVGVIAREGDPSRLNLKDIARAHPGFVAESDGIFETVCWLRQNRLRVAIVHDQAGAVLGIVGLDQLVETLAAEFGETAPSIAGEASTQRRNALH